MIVPMVRAGYFKSNPYIVACRNFGENAVTLTTEEREVITKAYQYAWADGKPRFMSGAHYEPYSGEHYTFRYSESDEYVFLYYYDILAAVHWVKCLTEIRRILPDCEWYFALDDFEIPWRDNVGYYLPDAEKLN